MTLLTGCGSSTNTPTANLAYEELIDDILGNKNKQPITATELNSLENVSGALENINYTKGFQVMLSTGGFKDPQSPTSEEIQAVINAMNINKDGLPSSLDTNSNIDKDGILDEEDTFFNTDNNEINHTIQDQTIPLITLNGLSEVMLTQGTTYIDAGAKATDNKDGNLTSHIIIHNPIDTDLAGTYTITYDVNDSTGNQAIQLTRTVKVTNTAPSIFGIPNKTVHIYDNYQFLPQASDSNNDTLTFSINNKPSWAEFNTTTGLLHGEAIKEGNYSNITIFVTDGNKSSALPSFTIKVLPAINLAHIYGKVIQGDTWAAHKAIYAIDENNTTYNHANDVLPNNWWQLALPNGVKIHKIVLYNNHLSHRLKNAKLYLNNTKHTIGSTDMGTLSKTLKPDAIQIINYDPPMEKSYILLQGNIEGSDSKSLHLNEVKVYGELPYSPQLKKDNYLFYLPLHASIGTVIGKIEAFDYQSDILNYSIIEDTPFKISSDGTISLKVIPNYNIQPSYQFDIKISDGIYEIVTHVTIKLLNTNGVKVERWTGIGGSYVHELTESEHFKNDKADLIAINNSVDDYEPAIGGYSYGQKLTTLLRPQESGKYIFNLVGDKRATLWLSSDENVSNLKKLAETGSHSNIYKGWHTNNARQSVPIELKAGKLYYLKVLHKDGGYPNFVSVGWKKVTDTDYVLIPKNQLFVSILDSENVKPIFADNNFSIVIDTWQNKIEPIFTINALDYQKDTLTYAIEKNLPFSIDTTGAIRVNNLLTKSNYSFNIIVSDGVHEIKKRMNIKVIMKAKVKEKYKTNISQPAISGYLPNTYTAGDIVSVDINGSNYAVTINNNASWSLDKDTISPALSIGDYNLTLHLNNETIDYENYFEVYGSKFHKFRHDFALNSIDNINITIASHSETPLQKNVRIRGSYITLSTEDNITKLKNNSYRTIKSLLGKYKDENNNSIFVTLTFDTPILPYSENNLSTFPHNNEIEIVITANQYDFEVSFGGGNCDENTPTDKTKYCLPTNINETIYSSTASHGSSSEQQFYSRIIATQHHFYNSVHALETIRAWTKKSTYNNMDFSSDDQSLKKYIGDGNTDTYLYTHFMDMVIPNHHTEISTMRYKRAAEGMAGVGKRATLTGTLSSSSWAAEWEGHMGDYSLYDYEIIYHEMAHSFGYLHSSGMTYGWANTLKKVVNRFYTVGEATINKVPLYIFETKALNKKQLQITIHKTALATEDNLHIEILSSLDAVDKNYILSKRAEDKDNQITLTMDYPDYVRFFIRIFGEDSNEMMSQLISLKDIVHPYIGTNKDTNESYYAISDEDWKKTAKAAEKTASPAKAQRICKIWFGSDAHIAYEQDANIIENKFHDRIINSKWLTSKKFINKANRVEYNIDYYTPNFARGSTTQLQEVIPYNVGIFCVKPNSAL